MNGNVRELSQFLLRLHEEIATEINGLVDQLRRTDAPRGAEAWSSAASNLRLGFYRSFLGTVDVLMRSLEFPRGEGRTRVLTPVIEFIDRVIAAMDTCAELARLLDAHPLVKTLQEIREFETLQRANLLQFLEPDSATHGEPGNVV